MRGNLPIPELPHSEDVWLVVVVTSVRERRTQQGKVFHEANARNVTGSIPLKIWGDISESRQEIRSGLWGITGRLEVFQDRPQFVVSEYRPITVEQYRQQQQTEPPLPRAFTLDTETLATPDFRERVGPQLERLMRLGNMRLEQQQRYLEDIAAEEERCYQLGALNATSGRLLSLAAHIAPVGDLDPAGLEMAAAEHVFGIDTEGNEEPEKQVLRAFLALMKDFDPEVDELVGHNLIGFDLPFIFQRCLVHSIPARPLVNLAGYQVQGVFDTMHHWWLGAKRHVSLDDIAWALGMESSKTADVEGSKVFDLYHAGRLKEIREYNLNDVRLTRRVYERILQCFGRF